MKLDMIKRRKPPVAGVEVEISPADAAEGEMDAGIEEGDAEEMPAPELEALSDDELLKEVKRRGLPLAE